MLVKITYTFFCFLLITGVSAQQQNIGLPLLDSLKAGINNIVKNADVADTCKKRLAPFQQFYSRQSAKNLDEKKLKTLVDKSNALIRSVNEALKGACRDERMKGLVTVASNLISDANNQINDLKTAGRAGADSLKKSYDTSQKKESNSEANLSTEVQSPGITSAVSDSLPGSQQPVITETFLSTFSRGNNLLIISVSVLFVLIVLVSIVYLKTMKDSKTIIKEMKEIKAGMQDATIPATDDASGTPLQIATDNQEAGEVATAATALTLAAPVHPAPFFVCEVMMTAGPRKKFMGEENADKDLGEDVCGFVSDAENVLVWLLDGTSDLHCLKHPDNKREYFSSRLLAMGIAEKLRKYFIESADRPMGEMVAEAIQEVRSGWLKEIDRLPESEKLLLKSNLEDRNYPECAATMLIARLSLNGKFAAYRSGDSKMFVFNAHAENGLDFMETSLSQKNDKSNDRIFFRLRLDDQGRFDIVYNEPLHEIITLENVNTIISFSDGIGMETESLLTEEYKSAPGHVRKEIIYHKQATGDDKTICFIEIKKRGNT